MHNLQEDDCLLSTVALTQLQWISACGTIHLCTAIGLTVSVPICKYILPWMWASEELLKNTVSFSCYMLKYQDSALKNYDYLYICKFKQSNTTSTI
jgi:hypothetical protein